MLHTYQDDYYKKKKKRNQGQWVNDVVKLKPLHTFAQNNAYTMKNIIEGSSKVKNRNTIWYSNPASEYLSKRIKIRILKSY